MDIIPFAVVDLEIMFALFDKDGDGQITYDEFCHVIDHLGVVLTVPELRRMFDKVDIDSEC